jgi:hypothetical protein
MMWLMAAALVIMMATLTVIAGPHSSSGLVDEPDLSLILSDSADDVPVRPLVPTGERMRTRAPASEEAWRWKRPFSM